MKSILFTALALCTACSRTDVDAANTAASVFTKNIQNSSGFSCAEVDTDNDGYVTCTVFRGSEEPMQIQCGSERWCIWNCARGCKYVPAMKIR